jgi:tetratricopeptide (TPR) repeat protein
MTFPRKARFVAFAATLLLTTSFVASNHRWTSSAQSKVSPPPQVDRQAPSPEKPAAAPKEPDYSQEAVVIQQLRSSYRFESNGTGQREMAVRVKVQSEAGLERFGQLVFPYSSANEQLNVDYVRVRKADGTAVSASNTDIQDLTAPVTREAPIYTDLRQKHVTVPGLRPGDLLEYRVVWNIHTALAPNHFWLEHRFITQHVIVLNDELEVSIPVASKVKLKLEPGFEPSVKDQEGRRVYAWRHSNLKTEDKDADEEKDEKEEKLEEQEEPKPHVQLTTFQNWSEVGQWYDALQRDRIVPDDKVKVKAEELIRGLTGDKEKVQSLYEFVAKNFRYVSLSLGQGRYQPHVATQVLANEYGDCKDKHTLFAAMLSAIGLRAYPALINSSRKIDVDVPSPAQFDHVITAIPMGPETFWADTTPEVAPFRLLSPSLRDKKALLVPTSDAARLETTPAEPPFVSSESVTLEGQVNEIGRLSAHARLVLRGDAEMYFRLMFRRTPKSSWKDLGYYLASVTGVQGEVTAITASEPAALEKPFELEFDVKSENFLDWSSKKLKVNLPLPPFHLKPFFPKRNSSKPIPLGLPIEISYRLKLTLPARYQAKLPLPLSVKRDYAEYQSVYKLEGNTVLAERTLRLRQRELPADRVQDYQAFVAAARSDEGQNLALETDTAGTPAIPDSVKTEELIHAAGAALKSENYAVAEELLKRVLKKEEKEKDVRRSLAYAFYMQRKYDEAIRVLQEQTKINPFDDYAYSLLGRVHWQLQQYVEAETAFRKQIEISPLDRDVHGNLGRLFVEWRKYKEAIPELEKAISLDPEDEMLQVSLGRAYLSLGETRKGIAAFDEAVKIEAAQHVWNDVAYFLAVNNVELEKAQQYAESAVAAVSTDLRNVDLQNLTLDSVSSIGALIANWDTLGWVHFQKGEIDLAEKYIKAAWLVGQHSEVGYHLGRIAEKRGNLEQAIAFYAQAAGATRVVPEAMESLTRLVAKDKVDALVKKAKEELPKAHNLELGVLIPNLTETTEAEFWVTFVPDASRNAQTAEVKFIRGSDKLKNVGPQLKSLRYNLVFPGDSPTKIIRRGAVLCLPKPGACSFFMLNPELITSLN